MRSKIDYLVENGKLQFNEDEIQGLLEEYLEKDPESRDSEYIREQLRSKIPDIPSFKEGMGGYLELYFEMVDFF